jgi:hypothetical protein
MHDIGSPYVLGLLIASGTVGSAVPRLQLDEDIKASAGLRGDGISVVLTQTAPLVRIDDASSFGRNTGGINAKLGP